MKKRTDEIDLLDLLFKCVNLLRENNWLIISFFLLGIALGVITYFTSREIFENRMVVSSGILTKTYGKILLDKVNRHLNENNDSAIAADLQISAATIEGIRHLRIEDVSEEDKTKESDRFIIIAETYRQDILTDLQQGLVRYLENNDFAKVRVEQNKKYLQQMISKIDQELNDMEDFKTRLFKGDFLQSSRGNVMFDPTVVNSKILDLTKEKINLQNAFALANSVQVIEGFTPFEKPSKPRMTVSIGLGGFMGLFFVGILIAFKSIRRLLRMADAAQQTR